MSPKTEIERVGGSELERASTREDTNSMRERELLNEISVTADENRVKDIVKEIDSFA